MLPNGIPLFSLKLALGHFSKSLQASEGTLYISGKLLLYFEGVHRVWMHMAAFSLSVKTTKIDTI